MMNNRTAKIGIAAIIPSLSLLFLLLAPMGNSSANGHLTDNNNEQGNLITYQAEQEGDIIHLYPNMLIDEMKFISLSGSPTLVELGRTESPVGTFITAFVIDTSAATFTEGSFTKRVEGKELYVCTQWENGCLTNWSKVEDLSGAEYTFSIQSGRIAYGETILPSPLGISSELGILSAISSTQADGLIAYGELNIALPRYRTWNSSNNFSAEQNALSLGTAGTDDITWVVTRANHERDEIIMGTEDKSNDVNIQVYTPANNSWSDLLEVSVDIPNSAHRAFDIAIEDISGDVLLVYENSSTADNVIAYRIWNRSGYSAPSTLMTGLSSSTINWIMVTSRAGSDDMMLLIHNSSQGLHAFPWNGTGFDTTVRNLTLSESTTSGLTQHFAFAWEASGQGLAVYGEGTNLVYRTYSPTAPHWSTEATISMGGADTLETVRLCSEPTSDYIGLIWQDAGNDVNVRMWDGTQIVASPPAEDSSTESSGANTANFDCAWYNSSTALFSFVDVSTGQNGLLSIDYFNFTKSNTWSVSDLTTTPTTVTFASDDIDHLRFSKHPTTNEIMVVILDLVEDVSAIRWNGTGFSSIGESPLETDTEVLNGAQEGVMFDWHRYDPVPNVTGINPNGLNFVANAVIDINATVFDNILIDTVLANITLPNNTIRQITLTNRSGNNTHFNSSFSVTDRVGTYTLRIIANDTSVHQNINNSPTVTFTVGDVFFPNVTNITPSGVNFPRNTLINVSTNVTDQGGSVSQVFANFTLPNNSIVRIELLNRTLIQFNSTFNITNLAGTYTLRIIANDTSNNLNSSETTTFTIGDVINPNVTNVTPASGTNFEAGAIVNITANVTDEVAVDTVLANITFPNSSIQQITLVNRSLRMYNGTFSVTSTTGTYTVRIIANDTTNNLNSSETSTFTIGDTIPPTITINGPANRSNFSLTNVTFNITVSDAAAANANCSLQINSSINQTNTSVLDDVATLFPVTGFLQGNYQWNVSCSDSLGNINGTVLRMFTIDLTVPQFNTLTTSPSAAADLDPNVNVTVLANVTDNHTAVHTVIFQHKLSNDSVYTNVTMFFSSGSGLYNTSFNATRNGTYDLRLWANDSVNNNDFSNLVNIFVAYDRNWTRTPSSFAAVTASASRQQAIGNLTINNSGDFSFSFNITSTSAATRYNETENFTLAAGAVKVLQVNDTAPTGGLKTITLNISVNDTVAVPRSLTTTGTIVVAPGQPVLVATITTPTTETRAVTQGDTGVAFAATLQNIGEGNATNVSFFFTVPSAWTITFGQTNISLSTLNSGESTENTIEVTILSTATAGTFTVVANSTGINASGADLGNASLIFGDTVSVTVNAVSGALGAAGGGGGAGEAAGAAAGAAGGGGGGGGTAGTVTKSIIGGQKQTIETTNIIAVTRGSGVSTPITIANLWENAILQDISLSVSGFLSQYVVISPEINPKQKTEVIARIQQPQSFTLPSIGEHTLTIEEIKVGKIIIKVQSEPQIIDLRVGARRYVDLDGDQLGDMALELFKVIGNEATLKAYAVKDFSTVKLAHGEALNYSLDIYAPSYLIQKDYELGLQIEAKLVPLNATAAGFTEKVITELRTLLFKVQEVSGEEARIKLDQARQQVQEIIAAEFNAQEARNLLSQAEDAFTNEEHDLVSTIVSQIASIHHDAFAAQEIIQQVQENIQKAAEKWLAAPQTIAALSLAQIAFERGDYATALERAQNAQLIHVLETKGRINLIKFVLDWWWALLLGLLVFSILAYFTYKIAYIAIIEQRLKNLNKEEQTIQELLEETQQKYFKDKSLSETQYKRYTEQYEKRLAKIRQVRAKLRNQRVAILKTGQELENIRREKKEVEELLKQNQADYFIKGKISRKKFMDSMERHQARLTEIESEESILQERLDQQKRTKKYKILTFMSWFRSWMGEHIMRLRMRLRKKEVQKKEKPVKKKKEVPPESVAEETSEESKKAEKITEAKPENIGETAGLLNMFNEKPFEIEEKEQDKPAKVQEESLPVVKSTKSMALAAPPKPSWWNTLLRKKNAPKNAPPKQDLYAGKWVEIKIPEKNIHPKRIIPGPEGPKKMAIINTPRTGPRAERMTETELRKKFPGAFP